MNSLDLHQALLKPETYPRETGPIEYRETHISRLYFTARHVYKVKKPVDFGFLNFTTLDRRRFYCQEEVRLNQRFCPDTYLGVTEIRREKNRIRIDGQGDVVDYAVVMNRLPEHLMLDRLIESGTPSLAAEMPRLGQRIAQFHRESEICRSVAGRSNLDVVRRNWQENFTQSASFVGETLSEKAQAVCSDYVERFLKEHEPLMLQREEDGFILDGHGDLHTEHICMTDPIRVYDCIEFNQRFRIGDVAADLAFLLMDLDFRGRRDLSAPLLQTYRQAAGSDPDLMKLLPFYQIYRAWVRGKVESFLSADSEVSKETRMQAQQRARQYFNRALGYLVPPALILTCGYMGVGKTTVGQAVAKAIDAPLLRSDALRKELAGIPPEEKRLDAFGKGLYRPAMTRRTYRLLLERSGELLAAERPVVADASFAHKADRELFRDLALRADVPCLLLFMECDRQTALNRLRRRRNLAADASDGRPELFDRQTETFESPEDETGVIKVDTSRDVDYNANLILAEIIERTGARP